MLVSSVLGVVDCFHCHGTATASECSPKGTALEVSCFSFSQTSFAVLHADVTRSALTQFLHLRQPDLNWF
jgi:hypothetical protein